MPRTEDNICEKSSEFHFVNDFLYKEVSLDPEGHNKTYAERYYPEGYVGGVASITDVIPEKKVEEVAFPVEEIPSQYQQIQRRPVQRGYNNDPYRVVENRKSFDYLN